MRTEKGVIFDRDKLAILRDMRHKALYEKCERKESAEITAALYCGALLFAREKKLIDHNFARIMFNQFQKDFELIDSMTPAWEELKR